MNKYYSVAQLSERISETPEGFLICEGVAITRTGDLLYAPNETPIDAEGKNYVTISRTIEDIHNPETIASFEGKPVTINHPDDFVTPETWKELAVGIIQNVRAGTGEDEDKLLADLLITDFEAIEAVKSNRLREVSCGYEAEYVDDGDGKGRQKNILGNHVALVQSGRCGSECAIFDHAPKALEVHSMSMLEKLKSAIGKALDEAMPEAGEGDKEVMDLNTLGAKIADLEAQMANPELGERIAKLEEAIAKLIGMENMDKVAGDEVAKDMEAGAEDMCKDADTLARAEILVAGIAPTADVKVKALTAYASTADGKAVIDSLLAGKTFDTADKDMLFIAASELVKANRASKLAGVRVSLDSLTGLRAGEMTPEKINQMNAEKYGKKGV